MTAEDRIGAWLGHDREFREAVALVRVYLRDRGYKIGDTAARQTGCLRELKVPNRTSLSRKEGIASLKVEATPPALNFPTLRWPRMGPVSALLNALLTQHARYRLRGVGLAKLIEKATSRKLLRHAT
jgi:hypothetical protein